MAFLGMRGTGDWADGQDPQNWNEMVLYQYPNGDTPLTAILSMMESKQINSTVHNWWEESDPTMGGAVSNVYIDAAMATAYVYATHQATFGIANATVYVKIAAAVAQEMNAGAMVKLVDSDHPDMAVIGKVTGVLVNGASSRLTVKLMEADDNGATIASYNLATVDYIQISGHKQPQGAALPTSIHYNPSLYTNYMHILEEPFNITRTARKTKLRTEDQYQADKMKALQRHARKRELAYLNSVLSSVTGDNGEPELSMNGIIPVLRAYEGANGLGLVDDFRYNTNYAGKTWKQAGEDWLSSKLEAGAVYGETERLGLLGTGAKAGINTLAKTYGNIQLQPGPDKTYGINTTTWVDQLTLHLKTAPLFSRYTYSKYSMLVLSPKNLTRVYLDDTHFKEDPGKDKGGINSFDGTNESYLVEETLEYHFLNEFMFLDGIGQDNAL